MKFLLMLIAISNQVRVMDAAGSRVFGDVCLASAVVRCTDRLVPAVQEVVEHSIASGRLSCSISADDSRPIGENHVASHRGLRV